MGGRNIENKTSEVTLNNTSFLNKFRQAYDYLAYSQYYGLSIEKTAERKVTNFFWKVGLLSSVYFAGAYSQSGKPEDLAVAVSSGIATLLTGILKLRNAYEDSQEQNR